MFSHNQKTLNLLADGILEDHGAEKLWKARCDMDGGAPGGLVDHR